jgi:hypothetical protein
MEERKREREIKNRGRGRENIVREEKGRRKIEKRRNVEGKDERKERT